ncbi:DUF5723 family protein [Odoribacter lunatus]|uniref:DUF5723 family protein n=1 Tax=Odoribacter lunatus TaxID=2941335 RepID=UPI002040F10F|nr:DUF5723 family protein [Odoribacter lunatus]
MKKVRGVITVLLLCLSAEFSWGQDASGVAYFLPNLPQRVRLNPAYQPEYKVWVGLPVLSGVSVNYMNSSFKVDDLLQKGRNDSVYVDMDRMYKSLRKHNLIHFDSELSLLTVGVKVKNWYATLDVTEKNDFVFRANKDLFTFLKDGNTPYLGKRMDIGDLGLELNAYEEFALGVSRKLNSKWTVGARAKFLLGIANARMTDSKISLQTEENGSSMMIRSKQDIRVSAPLTFENVTYGEPVEWDDLSADVDDFSTSMVLNTKNPGFALDLGAEYELSDKLKLYASVVDLGFIRWGAKNYRFTQNTEFDWKGGDVSNSIKKDDKSIDEVFDDLLDSLKNDFRLTASEGGYMTMLRSKMYLGATYQVAKMVSVGGLAELTMLNKKFYPSLTASADVRLHRNVTVAVAYTAMPGNYVNVGAGLTAKLGPVQLYASTDNVLGANYTHTQSLNARFGINLLFGHRDKGKKEESVKTEPVVVKKEPEAKKDTVKPAPVVKPEQVEEKEDTVVPPAEPERVVVSPVKEEMMIERRGVEEMPYQVIVGSFKNRAAAVDLKNKMIRLGFRETWVFQNEEGLFRVSCGGFETHDEAWDEVFRIRRRYPKLKDVWGLKVY